MLGLPVMWFFLHRKLRTSLIEKEGFMNFTNNSSSQDVVRCHTRSETHLALPGGIQIKDSILWKIIISEQNNN